MGGANPPPTPKGAYDHFLISLPGGGGLEPQRVHNGGGGQGNQERKILVFLLRKNTQVGVKKEKKNFASKKNTGDCFPKPETEKKMQGKKKKER